MAPDSTIPCNGSPTEADQGQLVWLITGTSSGFGRRLVISALARGDRVVATARSLDKLEALAANLPSDVLENFRTISLDITEGEDALKVKVNEAASFWGRIDVLVNNAGIGLPGLTEEGGSALYRRQFEANVFGLLDMTTATLPYLRASSSGCLVNIGSRSAWKTELPGIGPYSASKAAVHSLTETLATELTPFKVRVLLVAPGSFRTEGIYSQPYFTSRQLAEYDEYRNLSIKRFASVSGTEKGDPDKAMEVLVDVVRGEGVAKNRPWPGYLILGEDAAEDVKKKNEKMLKIRGEWEDVSKGVSFDETI